MFADRFLRRLRTSRAAEGGITPGGLLTIEKNNAFPRSGATWAILCHFGQFLAKIHLPDQAQASIRSTFSSIFGPDPPTCLVLVINLCDRI